MSEIKPITRKEALMRAVLDGKQVPFNPITREEAYLAAIANGGGSGGASSWNDLKDKPFEDNTVVYYERRDGYEPLDTFVDESVVIYKVSDIPLSADELCGVVVDFYMNYEEGTMTITTADIEDAGAVCMVCDGMVLSVFEANDILPLGRGLWLLGEGADYVSKLYKESVKKIEPKFLGNIIDVYEGDGAKIYHDRTGENAVTKAELKSMIDNGCIIRIMNEDSCKIPYLYNFEEEWAILTFGNPEGGWNFRYTAEKEEK